MTMGGNSDLLDRITKHTAATISKALDKMVADLPEVVAHQAVLELVVLGAGIAS
jgi:hypothetical protein